MKNEMMLNPSKNFCLLFLSMFCCISYLM